MDWHCLICSNLIDDHNSTREHVIPNALGGRLVTRQATCAACNLATGDTIDKRLIEALGKIALILDVPRERGEHPDLRVNDTTTGNKLRIAAGRIPEIGHNVRVEEIDGRRQINFFAPTKEAAERFITKQLKRKPDQLKMLEATAVEKPGFSFTFAVDLKGDEVARAIAKVACCFARYADVNLASTAIGPRFLRGDLGAKRVVAAVVDDVVSMPVIAGDAVTHTVVVYRPTARAELFAYVCLFQAFEFVVLLDDQPSVEPGFLAHYVFDLAMAAPVSAPVEWLAAGDKLLAWIEAQTLTLERQVSRAAAGLIPCLSDRRSLYIRRAVWRYITLLKSGKTEQDAKASVSEELKQQLRAIGEDLDTLDFNISMQAT